ncbi:hypothetical protein MLD38_024660 [Melastoma candidum]|uniref:Uncharacterized protein n=1 Tax=Melastoma candidum TaxID=119954 RepID=A0ACB9NVQ2_9MYRT|nr:hypothetical protein MLD38_024660 [Melastoma candidum]
MICSLKGRAEHWTRGRVGSDEIQLRIDPVHGDLDEEITGLRKQVLQLRNVAQEIESEAKFQNDMLNQLQMTLIEAQAGVKNNVRRLNQSIVQYGSSNVAHVVAFALVCFFMCTCGPKCREHEIPNDCLYISVHSLLPVVPFKVAHTF